MYKSQPFTYVAYILDMVKFVATDIVLGVTLVICTVRCGLNPFYSDTGEVLGAYDAKTLASTTFAPPYRPFNGWFVAAVYGHLILIVLGCRQPNPATKVVLYTGAFVFAELAIVMQFVQRAISEQQSLKGFAELRIPALNYILTFTLSFCVPCLMLIERRWQGMTTGWY